MQNYNKNSTLLNEERRTTIWFLVIFYSIYVIYDVGWYYIFPYYFTGSDIGFPDGSLNYIIYVVMFGLLPVSYYLFKRQHPERIKYIYFITFTVLNIISECWYYLVTDYPYISGNIIEIVIVLFAPIFVNKRFYYLVSIGTVLKFVIVLVIIQDPSVLLPLLIVVLLAIIAYILLHRFYSYVEAVKISYDKQLEGIVKGIIATLELKDKYTRGHSERVASYAMSLAKATNKFKEEELASFYYACLLHDIGKINIPDSILSKPGKLTPEEFEIIKSHPVVGANAVEQVEGISDYLDVIKHHHERWDGKGYPDGLKGEETSFLARVTAIADAFDAMTSSRSYRNALPVSEAYNRIIEGSGTQFDPNLVCTFKDVYPDWENYHKIYHN